MDLPMISAPTSLNNEAKCPKCGAELYLVIEEVTEKAHKLGKMEASYGVYEIIPSDETATYTKKEFRIYCITCAARFFSLEHGKIQGNRVVLEGSTIHQRADFRGAYPTSAVLPACFTSRLFKLCERPRNKK